MEMEQKVFICDIGKICAEDPCTNTLTCIKDLEPNKMLIPSSTLILSRIGVDFIKTNASDWTICTQHEKKFLKDWRAGNVCSNPEHDHSLNSDDSQPRRIVSTKYKNKFNFWSINLLITFIIFLATRTSFPGHYNVQV